MIDADWSEGQSRLACRRFLSSGLGRDASLLVSRRFAVREITLRKPERKALLCII